MITNTTLASADSALEAICVSPRGEIRLQLARQLTAMALNCAVNGFGGDCSGHARLAPLFALCNDACAQNTNDVGDCIGMIDCFNNGGDADPVSGLCMVDSIANCHLRPLPSPYDGNSPASSSQACASARKNTCTVLPSGEQTCTSGLRDVTPETCTP